jgi:hypothetical protein
MFLKIKSGFLLHNLYWISSIVFSLVIISSVVISTVSTVVNFDKEQFIQIPVLISAIEEANYADGVEEFVFPGVDLSIVKEVLSDLEANGQGEEVLDERVSQVVEQLQQPVPLATNPIVPTEEELVNNNPVSTEPASQSSATNTSAMIPSSTITNTSTFTQTATNPFIPSIIPVTGTSTSTIQPTNRPTFASTWTPTFTLTPSLTNSLTPTFTLTPSLTNSLTPTYTLTPLLTNSLTPTYTLTPSLTSSLTPTFTLTPSLTNSLTPTLTLTPSLISSSTPTFTLTATSTYTVTPTWTSSGTPSMTFTPTFTSTPTQIPSMTPTFTFTPTPTVTIATCNVTLQGSMLQFMWPADGSINVPLNIRPVIVFNQSMNASTLTYGDANHIVICQKVSDSSNSCRNGTEIPARVEILSVMYRNDWVNIYPLQPLEKGIRYTLFAGNQIVAHPDCSSYSKPLGGRVQSNFITILQ